MSDFNKENLFEGIQIMTAQELNSTISSGETTSENNEQEQNIPNSIEITTVDRNESIDADTTESANNEINNPVTTSSKDFEGDKKDIIYKALLKEMVNEGVLTLDEADKLEEMEGSFETVKTLMEKTVSKNIDKKQDEWKNSLSKSKKRFLEIEDAFDSDDNAVAMAQRLEFFDTITDEVLSDNIDLQKNIYHEFLITKGFSKSEADEEVEDADSLGKLEDKAIKALPQLKQQATSIVSQAREIKIKQQEQNKVEIAERFDKLFKSIETKESFIDGINLNKIAKDKLKENITKTVHTDASGRQYNSLMYKQNQNSTDFEMLINYYDSIGLFNMDKSGNFKPDISKLKNVAKTAAVNELDKVISQESNKSLGRNTVLNDSNDRSKDLANWLEKAYQNNK